MDQYKLGMEEKGLTQQTKQYTTTAIKHWKSQTAEFHFIGKDFEYGQKF